MSLSSLRADCRNRIRNQLDLRNFSSYAEVFAAFRKSTVYGGLKLSSEFTLMFSAKDLGFLVVSRLDPTIREPVCPIKFCSEMTAYGKFCIAHWREGRRRRRFTRASSIVSASTSVVTSVAGTVQPVQPLTSSICPIPSTTLGSQSVYSGIDYDTDSDIGHSESSTTSSKIGLYESGRADSQDIRRVITAITNEIGLPFKWKPTTLEPNFFDLVDRKGFFSSELGVYVYKSSPCVTSLTISATNGNGRMFTCAYKDSACFRVATIKNTRGMFCRQHYHEVPNTIPTSIPDNELHAAVKILVNRATTQSLPRTAPAKYVGWIETLRYLYKKGEFGVFFSLGNGEVPFEISITEKCVIRTRTSFGRKNLFRCIYPVCFKVLATKEEGLSGVANKTIRFCEKHESTEFGSSDDCYNRIISGITYGEEVVCNMQRRTMKMGK